MSAPQAAQPITRTLTSACPVCGSLDAEPFLEARGVPTHVGVLWNDPEAARSCSRGDLELLHCPRCGHMRNAAFDPAALDYGQDYDNSLHGSAVFRSFERDLVRLLARPDLRDELVVEIGPGDGRFLRLLCETAGARGVGFEPGLTTATASYDDGRVELRSDSFTATSVDEVVRMVCCRQVLEHIDQPTQLLAEVRQVLDRAPGGRAYVEVPNSELFLRDLSIWDLVYEHCQYFVAPSFRRLFEVAGFEILDEWSSYEHQFLSIEVGVAAPGEESSTETAEMQHAVLDLTNEVRRFAARFAEKSAWWRKRLIELAAAGQRTVLWGGGARAVSFVNIVAADGGIDFAVDVNPAKQGTFLAGTGHAIRSPDSLRSTPPDVVVVLNPIYLGEIRTHLAALGLDPEVLTA
jgi:SAM-dependent methyltransferase